MTKIKVEKKEFIKVLNVASAFAGRSKALPILDCVKIKVNDNVMTVVSTDNENAISKKMEVLESDGNVTFCVNYKDFPSYIKLVSGDNVLLEVDDAQIRIEHEKGSLDMPVHNDDEYPSLKMDEDYSTVQMDSATLNNWIVDSRNFVADDELRPVMNDIYFYCKEGETGCCASDGHYMFSDRINGSGDDFTFMLNKNAFKSACDVCQTADSVTIKIGTNNVMIVGDGISLLSRLRTGNYPNFKSVIPASSTVHVKVLKSELLDAINRVKVGASSLKSLVKVVVDGMNMQISAEDIDFSRNAVENMMVEADGNITIGFHAGKLLTCLNAINSEYVKMNLTEASKPCVMNEDDENSNKIVLLMPMMLVD